MARSHLERWDGTGGPDHLAGAAIPIFARVLAVADAIDHKLFGGTALVTAFAGVAAESGTRFCPNVVEAARRCLAADPRCATTSRPEESARIRSMADPILLREDAGDGVVLLTLNRPESATHCRWTCVTRSPVNSNATPARSS